ncbi:MAG: primosomal protein N' [Gemmataceae bacterium]|nr:primosomal protein N' [Gemmataceae bacterium]
MTEPSFELFEPPAPPSEAATLFAEVVFDRPLDHAYTYAVPAEFRNEIAIGKRLLAPFGRGDRATPGFCVGIAEEAPPRKVKAIQRVLDEEALLTENLLKLTRWMADYYLCGWGQVLNAVVPAGVKQQAGTKSVILIEATPATIRPNPMPRLPAKQKTVFDLLDREGTAIEANELARRAAVGNAPIRALLEKGLARRIASRVESSAARAPSADAEREPLTPTPNLTPDQLTVWAEIERALRQPAFQPILLHGVTGSGKTEIYLRAIEETLRQGKEALVLVPEISLTPQTIQSFRGRCGEIAVLHSHLHDAERSGHWRRIYQGKIHVVVGARSAVFAPTRNLGIIIIDEEHESSFKQETTPRYHARDVAIMRANLEKIPILLGSATPSLESWHNAQRGTYRLLKLPCRVFERPMPPVQLVDLRHDKHPDKRYHGLSPSLERAMKQTLQAGNQVLLLLNRRGFATFLHCPACGYVQQCKFCDLALTFHREKNIALCHLCGYQCRPPERCPECGAGQVRYHGMGTEKLEAEIATKFPDHLAQRMDSDTMRQHGSHKKALEAFRRGETHILLGTQMIAKGLDFPNVTLVGVVNADVTLHLPDFRAPERTFQLLAQVAGRTGRGPKGGRVLVQTMQPEHPSIAKAATHDYLAFAEAEMDHREKSGYPPFQRMARLVLKSKDEAVALDYAERLAAAFGPAIESLQRQGESTNDLRILGPAEAPVFRVKGWFRFHFQLQSPHSGFLHRVLRQALPTVRLPHGVELTVDIDPYDML